MEKKSSPKSGYNVYDDGNIPEIDLPKPDQATNAIPQEMPYREKTQKEAQR